MPVMRCQEDGKPGYKYGKSGKCYTYTTEKGKEAARKKAVEQGKAIEWSKHNEQTRRD